MPFLYSSVFLQLLQICDLLYLTEWESSKWHWPINRNSAPNNQKPKLRPTLFLYCTSISVVTFVYQIPTLWRASYFYWHPCLECKVFSKKFIYLILQLSKNLYGQPFLAYPLPSSLSQVLAGGSQRSKISRRRKWKLNG